MVCGFEPHVGLRADSAEPGAGFRSCVSHSLHPSPAYSLSLSLKNKSPLKNVLKQVDIDLPLKHLIPSCSSHPFLASAFSSVKRGKKSGR